MPVNASNQMVSWNSSDPAVAQVDQNGEVTPIAEGTAVVTVTTVDGGFTATASDGPVGSSGHGDGDRRSLRYREYASGRCGGIGGRNEGYDRRRGRFTVNNVAAGDHALTVTARRIRITRQP